MTTRPAPVVPDWLAPSAKVVVHASSGYGGDYVRRTTIAKVATHSFTVAGSTMRFRISTLDHHEPGWSGRWTRVHPEDSDLGRRLLAEERVRRLVVTARVACEEWIRTQDGKTRLAAIAALQAVED